MYDIKLEWFGEQRKREIRHHVNNGMVKATKFLWREVKKKIGDWGSNFLTSLKRLRVRHSTPGDPPFKQTGNLEKSIDFKYTWGPDGYIVGNVFSTSPYAETLEKGGMVQIDQDEKIHTSVRLVNPFKKAIFIAARPFMVPTLRENTEKIIHMIMRG